MEINNQFTRTVWLKTELPEENLLSPITVPNNTIELKDDIIKLSVKEDDPDPNPDGTESIDLYDPFKDVNSDVNNKIEFDLKDLVGEADETLQLHNQPFGVNISEAVQLPDHYDDSIKEYECYQCRKSYQKFNFLNRHLRKIHPVRNVDRSIICDICNVTFINKQRYHYHRRTYHTENGKNNSPFKCELCGKSFQTDDKLNGHHLRWHRTDQPLTYCGVCKKGFLTASHLKIHMRLHTGEKPYSCTECSKRFHCPASFRNHKRTHPNAVKQSFECPICTETYPTFSQRQTHLRSHTNIICIICRKLFATLASLKHHKNIHTTALEFACDLCGRNFNFQSGLRVHYINNHANKDDSRIYRCDICSVTFTEYIRVKLHVLLCHVQGRSDEEAQRNHIFDCAICEFKDNDCQMFRQHLNDKHVPQKSLKCEYCGKLFRHMFLMLEHQRVHRKENRFQCDTCGKGFNFISNFQLHMRQHDPNHKPFGCSVCAKRYFTEARMEKCIRRHELKESKIKERGTKIKYRKNSKRTVSDEEKPYQCEICLKKFLVKRSAMKCEKRHDPPPSVVQFQLQPLELPSSSSLIDLNPTTSTNQIPIINVSYQFIHNYPVVPPIQCIDTSNHSSTYYLSDTNQSVSNPIQPPPISDTFNYPAPLVFVQEVNSLSHQYFLPKSIQNQDVLPDSSNVYEITTPIAESSSVEKGNDVVNDDCQTIESDLKIEPIPFHEYPQPRQRSVSNPNANPHNECPICHRRYSRPNALKMHLRTHSDEKDFKCGICSRQFGTRYQIQRHTKFVHATIIAEIGQTHEVPYRCDVCSFKCSEFPILEQHIIVNHTKESTIKRVERRINDRMEPKQCEYCVESFECTEPYLIHLRKKHKIAKPFKCDYCPLSFSCRSNLNTHILQHRPEKMFQCDECGACFKSPQYLYKHIRCMHLKNRKHFKCPVCSMNFITEKGMLSCRHKSTSKRRRRPIPSTGVPEICSICSKVYKHHTSKLRCEERHRRKILDPEAEKRRKEMLERPYQCIVCLKCFAHKRTLRRCVRRHEQDDRGVVQPKRKSTRKKKDEPSIIDNIPIVETSPAIRFGNGVDLSMIRHDSSIQLNFLNEDIGKSNQPGYSNSF